MGAAAAFSHQVVAFLNTLLVVEETTLRPPPRRLITKITNHALSQLFPPFPFVFFGCSLSHYSAAAAAVASVDERLLVSMAPAGSLWVALLWRCRPRCSWWTARGGSSVVVVVHFINRRTTRRSFLAQQPRGPPSAVSLFCVVIRRVSVNNNNGISTHHGHRSTNIHAVTPGALLLTSAFVAFLSSVLPVTFSSLSRAKYR